VPINDALTRFSLSARFIAPLRVFMHRAGMGAAVFCLCLSMAATAEASSCRPSDFKTFSLSGDAAKPLRRKFEDWVSRTTHERETTQTSSHPKIAAWRGALAGAQLSPRPYSGFDKINRITNKTVDYKSDYTVHHMSDYWATPVETLIDGGDCEDIALLKAVALYHKGWPHDKMFLLLGYTRYRGKRIAHAVLLVDNGGEYLVMDNLVDRLIPFSEAMLQPLYMLNERQTRLFYLPGSASDPRSFSPSSGRG